jgi:hypothetical protein
VVNWGGVFSPGTFTGVVEGVSALALEEPAPAISAGLNGFTGGFPMLKWSSHSFRA